MNWFVYEIGPIDNNWDKLQTVYKTAEEIGAMEASHRAHYSERFPHDPDVESFILDWEGAKRAAMDHGWDGDNARPPVVVWLPDERFAQFRCGFVIKQNNNGTTYVVSPFELSYLRRTSR